MADPRTFATSPEYRFNPRLGGTGRFVSVKTGRIVSRATVNAAFEARIAQGAANVEALSRSLAEGVISLAEWQTGMKAEIKLFHTMAGAVSRGGWDRLSPSDFGKIGNLTKFQYRKLQDFSVAISKGDAKLLNLLGGPHGDFLRRAKMYANAAYGTMDEMTRRGMAERGAVEERRIREAVNSCQTCIDEDARGWVKLGESRAIGDSPCKTNCRCRREYRNAAGEVFE